MEGMGPYSMVVQQKEIEKGISNDGAQLRLTFEVFTLVAKEIGGFVEIIAPVMWLTAIFILGLKISVDTGFEIIHLRLNLYVAGNWNEGFSE